MSAAGRLEEFLSNRVYAFLFFFSVALAPRIVTWALIPIDWNTDSYHHWQISYLSLKIGFPQLRMWDLNGCELYWGVVPHVVQALLLWAFSTASILPFRVLNALLGGVNSYLVYVIGRDGFGVEAGFFAGLVFALYPVAAVFDVIALQDTLALSFALLSICLFRSRPGWSGIMLALACQSRTEYWLVSIAFILGVALIERFSTRIQPFVFGWLGAMAVFCVLFRMWTSNPFYPLYWSLYNVFGGWAENGLALPFHVLMMRWIGEKLSAWSGKATGLLILGSVTAFCGVFFHMIRRRSEDYPVTLFFLSALVVFSPLFVTYFPAQIRSLLLMLRESMPIAAFGSILLFSTLSRLRAYPFWGRIARLSVGVSLVIIAMSTYGYFVPVYSRFQADTSVAFSAADRAIAYYDGGVIVCDLPTINYRLVSRWGVRASNLLGNHYSPQYYGVADPLEYAKWFERNNVTLWLYASDRAQPVWEVVSIELPDLLVLKEEVYGTKIFVVDRDTLERYLEG